MAQGQAQCPQFKGVGLRKSGEEKLKPIKVIMASAEPKPDFRSVKRTTGIEPATLSLGS